MRARTSIKHLYQVRELSSEQVGSVLAKLGAWCSESQPYIIYEKFDGNPISFYVTGRGVTGDCEREERVHFARSKEQRQLLSPRSAFLLKEGYFEELRELLTRATEHVERNLRSGHLKIRRGEWHECDWLDTLSTQLIPHYRNRLIVHSGEFEPPSSILGKEIYSGQQRSPRRIIEREADEWLISSVLARHVSNTLGCYPDYKNSLHFSVASNYILQGFVSSFTPANDTLTPLKDVNRKLLRAHTALNEISRLGGSDLISGAPPGVQRVHAGLLSASQPGQRDLTPRQTIEGVLVDLASFLDSRTVAVIKETYGTTVFKITGDFWNLSSYWRLGLKAEKELEHLKRLGGRV